jgi:hypothetical protein
LRWRLKKAMDIKVKTAEKGVKLAKYLFGGEIEDEIETISGKDVIGIYENVTFFDPKNNEILTKAKIDTGADSTSIDNELAIKLGFRDIIEEFISLKMPEDLGRDAGLKQSEELTEQYVQKFPERLVKVVFVKSSHGTSLRPYVRINIKLKETVFETIASISDRSSLSYPVIIGRKSLSKFLVDPSK